jgi:transposase
MNQGKSDFINLFINEYRRVMQVLLDHYWDTHNLDGNYTKKDIATCSFYFNANSVPLNTFLSGRSVACAATQVMGMINAALRKQQRRMYVLATKQSDPNCSPNDYRKLQSKIHKTKLVKPKISKKVGAELNSNIVDQMESSTKFFDIAFDLHSLFNNEFKKQFLPKNKIIILANKHKRYNHWENMENSTRMNSVMLHDDRISVRFKIHKKKKENGLAVGIDQGIKSVISATYSDGQKHQSTRCAHGHDLDSIIKKMENKKKGSKSYRRAQEHRKNYVNQCVNRLNLTGVLKVNLEELKNMGFKQITSSYLRRFPTQQIRSKLQSICEEEGVLLDLRSSPYKSQRCNDCGFVHVRNRSGKLFCCLRCGHTDDADMNSSANQLVELPYLDRKVIAKINTKSGFFWNPDFQGAYSPLRK